MMRLVIKKSVCIAALVSLFCSCEDILLNNRDTTTKTLSLTRSEIALANEGNQFAARMLDMYYKQNEGSNFVFSPVSIQIFLSMLNAMASDEQSAKILKMLGFEDSDSNTLYSFCKKLLETSPYLDSKTSIQIINHWWLNSFRDFHFYSSFSDLMKNFFLAESDTYNFQEEQVKHIIETWIHQKTQGMIHYSVPGDLPGQCYLAITAYFKSEWKYKFGKNNTRRGDFLPESGNATSVEFMNGKFDKVGYFSNEVFSSVSLPLGNGSFEMEFYLPNLSSDITEVINWLIEYNHPDKMLKTKVAVMLPKFDIECANHSLNQDIMSYFGVNLSDPGRVEAKYPKCGEDLTGVGMELDMISHVSRIMLDEDGAEAAAVTLNWGYGAAPGTSKDNEETFYAFHPFIFAIREVSSGIIFFYGVFAGK